VAGNSPSTSVHACLGYDLVQRVEDSWNERFDPIDYGASADNTFPSLAELQSQVNTTSDHGGAVYRLNLSQTNITNANSLDLRGRSNLTIYGDPNNFPTLSGNAPANRADSTAVTNFGIRFHGGGPSNNIKLANLNVERCRFNVYLMGNHNGLNIEHINASDSTFINFCFRGDPTAGPLRNVIGRCLKADGSGREDSPDVGQGENYYIGEGNDQNAYVDNIDLRWIEGYDSNAEQLDIKRNSRRVKLTDYRFEKARVHSQGAIVLPLDLAGNTPNYDVDIDIDRGTISDVRRKNNGQTNFNGNAIAGGQGNSRINNLIAWDIEDHVIDLYNDFDGPFREVSVSDSILIADFANGKLPVRAFAQAGATSTIDQGNLTESQIIVLNNQSNNPNYCLASPSDFVGPLTSLQGFRPV